MDQWGQAYPDSAGASNGRRYNGNSQMAPREYNNQQAPVQPPAGFKYEQFQGGLNSHSSPSSATSPITTPQLRDNNGDIPMQDAHDPYASMKYPMRPHHQAHPSGGSRSSNLHSPQEPSAAAQRYSPMEVMSPTSPYAKSTGGFSAPPVARQSPTRAADYHSPPSPYYQGSRQPSQQLPPIGSYPGGHEPFSQSGVGSPMEGQWMNDPKSPRRPVPQSAGPLVHKGPVPEFRKVRAATDLRPKVNSQPVFRRANPEGGFISVSISRKPPLLLAFSLIL